MAAMSFVRAFCKLELLSDLGFPALLDGEYRHSIPQARHREHIGRALEHLTLARKQPSQEARSRCWRGFDDAMVHKCLEVVCGCW